VAPWHARMLADTTSKNPWQRPGPAAYPTEGWPGTLLALRSHPPGRWMLRMPADRFCSYNPGQVSFM
jgi:hypothetical protein